MFRNVHTFLTRGSGVRYLDLCCDLRQINNMKPAQAKEIIRAKAAMLSELAETINSNYEMDAIVRFRQEFRTVRAFMTFMRLQRNDKNLRMPESCKYLYHLAGKIKEFTSEPGSDDNKVSISEKEELLAKAQKEWKKNYSKNTFLKFGVKVAELDFSKINPDLFDNFFTNIGKEAYTED